MFENIDSFHSDKSSYLNNKSIKKIIAIVIILCSGIISWLIANIGVDTGNMEMAAIANVFGPLLAVAASLILFLLIDWAFPKYRFWIMLILVILNLLCGFIIRIENVVV